jgi:anti-anti-sigma regulatory factor
VNGAGDCTVRVRLEGRIVGDWVEETRRECSRLFADGKGITLDLHDVSFADEAGAQLLRELAGRGVRLTRSSPFLRELIGPEFVETGYREKSSG